MNKTIINDDLRYLIFSEIYSRFSEPKTRRKAFAILESSISCFNKMGFGNVTFKTLARESGLTPPSLRYYFSNLEELRELSIKYIHLTAQKIVVEALSKTEDPLLMMKGYLEAHLLWATHFKIHLCVWVSFISFSSRKKRDRALNTKAVLNGAARITELLATGRRTGVFKHENDFEMARILQTLILGWLTTLVTEDVENPNSYSESVIRECFKMITN